MRQPLIITKLQLLAAARRADCCSQYQMRILKAKNKDDLLRTGTDGLRFCLANDYPNRNYILRNFSKDELHRHGIYMDEQIEQSNPSPKQTIVALGGCTGHLDYNDWDCHRVAITHTGEVNIVARNHTFVIVYIYDRAKVKIHLEDHASVVAYFYGDAEKPVMTRNSDSRATYKVIHREIQNKQ